MLTFRIVADRMVKFRVVDILPLFCFLCVDVCAVIVPVPCCGIVPQLVMHEYTTA